MTSDVGQHNKDIYRRFHDEVFGKRNMDIIDELSTPDCVIRAPAVAGQPPFEIRGPEASKQLHLQLFVAFPDLQFTIDELIAGEDGAVTSRATFRGTHQGPLWGLPPTGRSATWSSISISRYVGGKFTEGWVIPDRLGLLQQLGIIPAPA